MCISSNSVNQAQDLMSVTKIEDFPNSLLPIKYLSPLLPYRCQKKSGHLPPENMTQHLKITEDLK